MKANDLKIFRKMMFEQTQAELRQGIKRHAKTFSQNGDKKNHKLNRRNSKINLKKGEW